MENVVDIARVRPSHDVLKLIPAKTARAIGALPLAAEAGKVVVCLADCTDFAAIERVEALFPGRPSSSPRRTIRNCSAAHCARTTPTRRQAASWSARRASSPT